MEMMLRLRQCLQQLYEKAHDVPSCSIHNYELEIILKSSIEADQKATMKTTGDYPRTKVPQLLSRIISGMIDRVPFLPEAVLVCFDTLNVQARAMELARHPP